jgi:hypothetical protein
MNYELEHILFLVKQAKPKSVADVQTVVEDYFRPISWSLLKEEYYVTMIESERIRFLMKIYTDLRDGVGDYNESRRPNQMDR